MQSYILYRYPREEACVFKIGEGDDSFYLCPFQDKQAKVFKGTSQAYEKADFPLSFADQKPYCASQSEYFEQFDEFQKQFREKDVSKAILSRVKKLELGSWDVSEIFEKMCASYPDAFCYLFSLEGVGTWAGASPEILLHYKDQNIRTVALAGTKYTDDPAVWTDKEKVEHQLVEDYIAQLHSSETPLLQQSKPSVIKAGKLFHLKSTFDFKADFHHVKDFLERIHPTPAVCGLPYAKSKSLILLTEKHMRSYYAGYLGVSSPRHSSFTMYVNIRCVQLFKNTAFLYIGGGITKDSQALSEWEETERKSMTMGKILSV